MLNFVKGRKRKRTISYFSMVHVADDASAHNALMVANYPNDEYPNQF